MWTFSFLDKRGILTYWYGPAAGARVGPLPYDYHRLAPGNNYSLQTKATPSNSQTSRTAASCASTRTAPRASTTTIATRASVKELDFSKRNNFHCELGLWINSPSPKRGTKKFKKMFESCLEWCLFSGIRKLFWNWFECYFSANGITLWLFSWKHKSATTKMLPAVSSSSLFRVLFISQRDRRLVVESFCLLDSSWPL